MNNRVVVLGAGVTSHRAVIQAWMRGKILELEEGGVDPSPQPKLTDAEFDEAFRRMGRWEAPNLKKPQVAREPVATTGDLASRYRQELNSLLAPHIHQNRMDSTAALARVYRHHRKLLARISPRGKRNLVLAIEGAI